MTRHERVSRLQARNADRHRTLADAREAKEQFVAEVIATRADPDAGLPSYGAIAAVLGIGKMTLWELVNTASRRKPAKATADIP